jgi:hypothetical protein
VFYYKTRLFKKELDLELKSIYAYLFEKVSDLESIYRLGWIMCFIISMRNYLTCFKIRLCRIEYRDLFSLYFSLINVKFFKI